MNTKSTLLDPSCLGVCSLSEPLPEVAHGIVSRAVLTAPGLRLTLFHFAEGQELSEHATPARALVQVIAGSCEFTFADGARRLKAGDLIHMPPRLPHAVLALEALTLLVAQVGGPSAGE